MKFIESFELTPDAAAMLIRLRMLAVKFQTICQQAPNIWDAETGDDARLAKMGCNGKASDGKDSKHVPPCPIKNLCLQTALATKSSHGVWGGLAAHERRDLRRNLR